jgi:hypothetical protein
MEKEKEVLRTYSGTWKFERKIYAIDKIRLLVPINVDDAAYLILGLLITILLLKIFPFLNHIPAIIRYGLLPWGLMKFLTKKKFDGKLPHRFLIGYLEYLTLPKSFSRFESSGEYKKGRFGKIACRGKEIINVTEILVKKGVKKHV